MLYYLLGADEWDLPDLRIRLPQSFELLGSSLNIRKKQNENRFYVFGEDSVCVGLIEFRTIEVFVRVSQNFHGDVVKVVIVNIYFDRIYFTISYSIMAR